MAAGAGAAAKARRTDEQARIIIFEKGPYVSFANCGLPYYVGHQIKERNELFLVTPERFRQRFNIDVRVNHEVTAINPEERKVEVVDHFTGNTFIETYDKLIIATGASPIKPPIEGVNLNNVYHLWTVPDADAVKAFIQQNKPQQAVVVGGGFIGLEAVENLLKYGIKVHLVEMLPQVMPAFDQEMTVPLVKHLRQLGVEIHLNDGVAKFLGTGEVNGVQLASGKIISAPLVILAVGVKPNTELAEKAGLAIGEKGGIVVDTRMRTSNPDIYAAGDVVEIYHLVSGKKVRIPLAGPANKQGRVAGANAAGGDLEFKGAYGTSIVKVGKLTAAKTGLNEREARDAGFDYQVSYTHSPDHAGYYPGAETMMVKVIFEKSTGRLLGGQIVGPKGVDKRIDVLATAIYSQLTVYDLEDLDLAYAPPYSSAKDPVIIAGMAAANILRGEVEVWTAADLAEALEKGEDLQLVDVRTPDEYREGHIPTAVNIPVDDLRKRIGELDPHRKTVLYCGIGYRSYLAYRVLKDKGFSDLGHLSGGYRSWSLTLPEK
ncbi:FAD-dependent pyridine nucleotide-disulfide oxidoreductase [Calderihabitans maritimus]|uniref:FAD-dependent pyridine nucleotide-disulfide oxidoreductase n=1 Tax=Calderihabitans maritimus TaxID=1246530 RepID=A0A1Z5HP17_9FIRM|nr:FAD-dependent pyridine nucleotide-disulfide oxidoreductase [Calderihabitans maritimus]